RSPLPEDSYEPDFAADLPGSGDSLPGAFEEPFRNQTFSGDYRSSFAEPDTWGEDYPSIRDDAFGDDAFAVDRGYGAVADPGLDRYSNYPVAMDDAGQDAFADDGYADYGALDPAFDASPDVPFDAASDASGGGGYANPQFAEVYHQPYNQPHESLPPMTEQEAAAEPDEAYTFRLEDDERAAYLADYQRTRARDRYDDRPGDLSGQGSGDSPGDLPDHLPGDLPDDLPGSSSGGPSPGLSGDGSHGLPDDGSHGLPGNGSRGLPDDGSPSLHGDFSHGLPDDEDDAQPEDDAYARAGGYDPTLLAGRRSTAQQVYTQHEAEWAVPESAAASSPVTHPASPPATNRPWVS
ncbi:hypothetical protein, partial [Actinoplanes sp. NPDC049599]|uniref:hypothetical protein n=1 Tax=Actinoplanes sp. NPDC049599 TaxID=3363903 RepID=UPI00378D7879